ncbi:hypothetical protein HaLaN_13082, partial [Haematococcus lacustris]
ISGDRSSLLLAGVTAGGLLLLAPLALITRTSLALTAGFAVLLPTALVQQQQPPMKQSALPDQSSGQLVADQLARWKLTKDQVKHDSGLNNARRDTEEWLAPIKPHLQHLAAASSAGTSLEANLKHITVTLATWVALEEDMAEVSMERHGRAKQLVVFYGAAGIGTGGGWGADAVLRACCKVVCRPRGTDQQRGGVVLVDEHRTTQAPHSSQEATPAAASEPGLSTPPPAKRSKRIEAEQAAEPTESTEVEQAAEPTQPTKGTGKSKVQAAKAKPAPQPGSCKAHCIKLDTKAIYGLMRAAGMGADV